MESKCGIYKITNKINNKVYIGKSINIHTRHIRHINQLKNNEHHSFHLQKAYNKYGKENFIFETIEECIKEDLTDKELEYIKIYDSENRHKGYNMKSTIDHSIRSSLSAIERCKKYTNKKVYQFDLKGNLIKEWESAAEAGKNLNIAGTWISQLCRKRGSVRKAKNFVFSYDESFEYRDSKLLRKLEVYNKINDTTTIYPSVREFCRANNIRNTSIIHAVVRNSNGKYKNFIIKKI